MKAKTRSILDELDHLYRERDSQHIIESRANNIITSAINLIDLIEQTYTEEEAEDLSRKLLNSIRTRDPAKFKRSLGRICEGKRNS